jgi:hypothetical protein
MKHIETETQPGTHRGDHQPQGINHPDNPNVVITLAKKPAPALEQLQLDFDTSSSTDAA